jgi:hypothetical protein
VRRAVVFPARGRWEEMSRARSARPSRKLPAAAIFRTSCRLRRFGKHVPRARKRGLRRGRRRGAFVGRVCGGARRGFLGLVEAARLVAERDRLMGEASRRTLGA